MSWKHTRNKPIDRSGKAKEADARAACPKCGRKGTIKVFVIDGMALVHECWCCGYREVKWL